MNLIRREIPVALKMQIVQRSLEINLSARLINRSKRRKKAVGCANRAPSVLRAIQATTTWESVYKKTLLVPKSLQTRPIVQRVKQTARLISRIALTQRPLQFLSPSICRIFNSIRSLRLKQKHSTLKATLQESKVTTRQPLRFTLRPSRFTHTISRLFSIEDLPMTS